MIRAFPILTALAVALSGCAGAVLTGDGHFENIETRELTLRVRISNMDTGWIGLAVLVDVNAPSSEWVSLTPTETLAGPVRRTTDGAAQFDLGHTYINGNACIASVCEVEYVIAVDRTPVEPWEVVVSATVDGDAREGASVEVIAIP